jgi:hypothetical protein
MASGFVANLYPHPTPGGTDERLAVSSSAVPFTTAWRTAASGLHKFVVIDVQTNDVMVTFDGSTPTSTNGHRFYAGEKATWSVQAATTAQFIRVSADAVVHATGFTI